MTTPPSCGRCGRDCSDGQCWAPGDDTREDASIGYCIACITDDERARAAGSYRETAREPSALAAELGSQEFEEEAESLLAKARRLEGGGE